MQMTKALLSCGVAFLALCLFCTSVIGANGAESVERKPILVEYLSADVGDFRPREIIATGYPNNPLVLVSYLCGFGRIEMNASPAAASALLASDPIPGLVVGNGIKETLIRCIGFFNSRRKPKGLPDIECKFSPGDRAVTITLADRRAKSSK